MMTNENVRERIDRLLDPIWTFEEIEIWYGIVLGSAPQSFLAQYRIWSERYRHLDASVAITDGRINRHILELFLQQRELVGLWEGAINLGMMPDSFIKTLETGSDKGFFSDPEAKGEFPSARVFRASLTADFHKRFPTLRNFTFSSFSGYCNRLHAAIKEELGVEVKPAYCATSIKLGEEPKEFAHDYDSITGEPMGLPFQVWLETRKPIQLKPDVCSWLTFANHESVLAEYADMQNRARYQEVRDALT
jgi:hypothetical protein